MSKKDEERAAANREKNHKKRAAYQERHLEEQEEPQDETEVLELEAPPVITDCKMIAPLAENYSHGTLAERQLVDAHCMTCRSCTMLMIDALDEEEAA